jgi:neutral ceramidase
VLGGKIGIEIKAKGEFRMKWKNIILLLLSLSVACSTGRIITVVQPEPAPQPPPDVFRAGAAEVDITPPPGLPLFGYSWEAAKQASGYWTRLKARAIVLEVGQKKPKKPWGKRLALVQVDLGAVSGLLQYEITKRLADFGFSPANIMLAASHSHGAPGGYFGSEFYNNFGSGTWGFYPQLVEWLASRISQSIKNACLNLAPAGIAVGDTMVEGLSRNRSLQAWIMNFSDNLMALPYPGIIPRVYVLRVDHLGKENPLKTTPIAAFVVAPVHATSLGNKNKLYHGDLHGAASRYLSAFIKQHYKIKEPFVAAVAAGPQGDVSPDWKAQIPSETKRLGHLLAEHAFKVFNTLDNKLQSVDLKYAYQEVRMSGAEVNGIRLCERPIPGVPALAGAEDGRSRFYGKLGVSEGFKGNSIGCQETKVPAFGFLNRLIMAPGTFPDIAPLQIYQLGDILTLATLPVEPTTETGRRIHSAMAEKAGTHQVAVVAVANEYMSYTATPAEYNEQHFEGAFTLFGPNQGIFFKEKLLQILDRLNNGDPALEKNNKRVLAREEVKLYLENAVEGAPLKSGE